MAHDRLRRMINEPTEATYTDEDLLGYLYETEDLNLVASIILMEKSAALRQTMYDYGTEGERFQLSQVIENLEKLAKYYSQKAKVSSSQWVKSPDETSTEETIQVG